MKLLLLFIILIVSTWPLKGQIADFDSEAIEQDFVYNLNVYSQAFVRPIISTYSSTQLAIQQTSGKTLAPWAFSIAVNSSLTFVDKSNLKFNFNALPFSDNIRLKNPNNPILPSALGGSTNQEFIYKVEGQSNLPFPFNGPVEYEQNLSTLNGVVTRWDAIPTAAMMTNLGLPYNTEVFIRFVPNLNLVGEKNI